MKILARIALFLYVPLVLFAGVLLAYASITDVGPGGIIVAAVVTAVALPWSLVVALLHEATNFGNFFGQTTGDMVLLWMCWAGSCLNVWFLARWAFPKQPGYVGDGS